MDNFFEILIYVIIIISFLSSILKKKQKPKQPPAQSPRPDEYNKADVSVAQTQPKEDYDIMREIEDFFKVGNELPEQEKVPIAQPKEPASIIQSKEQSKIDSWHSPTASEHTYTDDWELKKAEVEKKILQVDSGIEKQAAKFEESIQRKETVPGQLAIIITSKLGNPASLKEYIIFSEILGKPKALRR